MTHNSRTEKARGIAFGVTAALVISGSLAFGFGRAEKPLVDPLLVLSPMNFSTSFVAKEPGERTRVSVGQRNVDIIFEGIFKRENGEPFARVKLVPEGVKPVRAKLGLGKPGLVAYGLDVSATTHLDGTKIDVTGVGNGI